MSNTLTSENFARIWLEPREGADPYIGRQWCQDNQWGDDGIEYVRADLAALQSAANTPPDIDQVATRIASKYLTLDISCERLYHDVVEALTAERAVASRKSAADTPAPQQHQDRPLCAPIQPSKTDPAWVQVIKLFQRHGMGEPPVRLRDEIVNALSWAWYAQALENQPPLPKSPAFTSAEIEEAAAHCERVASEYEARANDPNCNRDHYLRAAERERRKAAVLRSRAALSPFKAKEE